MLCHPCFASTFQDQFYARERIQDFQNTGNFQEELCAWPNLDASSQCDLSNCKRFKSSTKKQNKNLFQDQSQIWFRLPIHPTHCRSYGPGIIECLRSWRAVGHWEEVVVLLVLRSTWNTQFTSRPGFLSLCMPGCWQKHRDQGSLVPLVPILLGSPEETPPPSGLPAVVLPGCLQWETWNLILCEGPFRERPAGRGAGRWPTRS